MTSDLNDTLRAWLDAQAEALDRDERQAGALLPQLAAHGLLRAGVAAEEGGSGGAASAAVAVVAQLARHSLAAAFVYWAQRAVVECLLRSPNRALAAQLLPRLLDGSLAGAPGLSNAMRSLSGFDTLQCRVREEGEGQRLEGGIPWATNLDPRGFVAVVVAAHPASGQPAVYALPHDAPGVERRMHADLLGLRATHTGSLRFDRVALAQRWLLHPDARAFLPGLRPVFLALQCGWGLGLARASLASARHASGGAPSLLLPELETLERGIGDYWQDLSGRLDAGALAGSPAGLFALRLRMTGIALEAVQLELQSLGARAWSGAAATGFARRWREAAFLPIVTPSAVQLKTELARLGPAA